MGHLRIRNLYKSKKWVEVIDLIEDGINTAQIASASLDASKRCLKEASKDAALVHTFWLLTQIPIAAKKENFSEDLKKLNLFISHSGSILEITNALSEAVDIYAQRIKKRSNLGEIAQHSASECLTFLLSSKTQSLFKTTHRDIQNELAKLGTKKQFGLLGREFIARFTFKYLSFFLSSELSNHVGGKNRFSNIHDHIEFSKALELQCRQASRIVEEFAGGWFTKTNYEGGITREKASSFIHVALKKFSAELGRGEPIEKA
jgi:hypothetical protein